MTLRDADILELNELCNAVVDGTLTEPQRARLSLWLADSEEARQFYVRVTGLSASLYHYAAEMQTEAPDAPPPEHAPKHRWWWPTWSLLAVAACIALVLWIGRARREVTPTVASNSSNNVAPAATDEEEFVARLTGSKECQWPAAGSAIAPGARLRKGQEVELAGGFAEITFDSGAQVVLTGPASLHVNSAWSATLSRGTLKASLPPEAMGFSITNPTVEVVDLGTEFTMFTDDSSAATEVVVLKGEVEAAPKAPVDQPPIVMREKESRRFATSGVSNMHVSDARFLELNQAVPLDRFVEPAGYAHWSFDEPSGDVFAVDSSGSQPDASAVQVVGASQRESSGVAHADGRWRGALSFDGRLYAKAAFPGISDSVPHTVSFWVRVPAEANLASAYAMVAWGVNNPKLGSHPFHIAWNRNPGEGIVGALRTDYGGGFAVGNSSLRDGRWHHVAVVFIPRDDAERPMEVKQYVDGRLEGEGRPSPSGSDIFKYSAENNAAAAAANGTVWLGCRLAVKDVKVRNDRFTGEMDELFIADRALEPQEIVRLMTSNQLLTDGR